MNPSMRKALMEVDRRLREKSICPRCGKPRDGFQWASGGRWRGTGRHGEATVTGEHVQSREEAGLCTCEEARK